MRRIVAVVALWVLGTACGAAPSSAATGAPQSYQGAGYGESLAAPPTGQMNQSKLWFHDSAWWALMFEPSDSTVRVAELTADHVWRLTDTVVDASPATVGDALWLGDALFVVQRNADGILKAVRLSYSATDRSYSVDAGFPVPISKTGVGVATIARDTTGRLWVTWTGSSAVRIAYSDSGGASWVQPFDLPAEGATPQDGEISGIVSFDTSIGVMWSDQAAGAFRFAVHEDGAPPDAWRSEVALHGAGMADDHLNIKVAPGEPDTVLAAVKTSLGDQGEPGDSPLVLVLARTAAGSWTTHPVSAVSSQEGHPMLAFDASNNEVHLLVHSPGGGGIVYHRSAAFPELQFGSGAGAPFIHLSRGVLTDAAGAKHPVSVETGLVVLASDVRNNQYAHGEAAITSVAEPRQGDDTALPTAPENLQAQARSSSSVSLYWSPATDGTRWWPGGEGPPVAGYVVYRDGVVVAETEATSYADNSAAPGRNYRYAVAAKDFSGNASPASAEVVVAVPEPGLPGVGLTAQWWSVGALLAVVMVIVLVGWRLTVVRRRRLPPVSPLAHGKHRARAKERSY